MYDDPVTYLIHFERPYQHARHYLGWTTDLWRRLRRHRKGRGARLLQVIQEAGIGWRLVRVWFGPRTIERALKRHGSGARHCPICEARRKR